MAAPTEESSLMKSNFFRVAFTGDRRYLSRHLPVCSATNTGHKKFLKRAPAHIHSTGRIRMVHAGIGTPQPESDVMVECNEDLLRIGRIADRLVQTDTAENEER